MKRIFPLVLVVGCIAQTVTSGPATSPDPQPVLPQSQHYGVKYVPAGTTLREVFVLPKLTIPDKRVLRIEMLEKALGNTGRKLSLEIKNKDILRAKNLK